MLYYAASENDVVTCENYAQLKAQSLSDKMFFLDEATDMIDTIQYCPMKIAQEYFTSKSIAAGDDYQAGFKISNNFRLFLININ